MRESRGCGARAEDRTPERVEDVGREVMGILIAGG
jgi:hypothetical protein